MTPTVKDFGPWSLWAQTDKIHPQMEKFQKGKKPITKNFQVLQITMIKSS